MSVGIVSGISANPLRPFTYARPMPSGANKQPILARFDPGQNEAALVIGMKLPVAEHPESTFAHQQGVGRCRHSLGIEQDSGQLQPPCALERDVDPGHVLRRQPDWLALGVGPCRRMEGHDERLRLQLDCERRKGAALNRFDEGHAAASVRGDEIGASLEA